tara:strand:- start:107 stop:328 length:222 start_codon:yes stop_codon:yes gene_type:complete
VEYIKNVGTAISQLGNAITGGNPNMTISARSYCENWAVTEKVINKIFFFEKDHCHKSWLRDVEFCSSVKKRGM